MDKHPLHKEVGKLLKEFAEKNKQKGFEERRAGECGGKHNLPLFLGPKKLDTELCNVDAMLLKGGKVAVIIEIEESNIKPTQICGKYLTTALSKKYIYKKIESKDLEPKSVCFIQILDISSPNKKKQSENIEAAMESCNLYGCVKSYNIIAIDWGKNNSINILEKELTNLLEGV